MARYWAKHVTGATGEFHDRQVSLDKYSPPAVLVPRYPGEPIRVDTWCPSHPRGSGRSTPLESIVNSRSGSGRFPLAAAWSGRCIQNAEWTWQVGSDHSIDVDPLDALSVAFREFVARYCRYSKAAIVIPNDLRQKEQQRIIDSVNQVHSDTQLLWLPVAASLAWLEDLEVTEWPRLVNKKLGDLVVIHCGWGHLQCSRLELHPIDRTSAVPIVPARRRPVVADKTVRGFGWTLVESGGKLRYPLAKSLRIGCKHANRFSLQSKHRRFPR